MHALKGGAGIGAPKAAVAYPAALSLVAIPVMLRGMPAKPETGSSGLEMSGLALRLLTWYGLRPDCSADLEGDIEV